MPSSSRHSLASCVAFAIVAALYYTALATRFSFELWPTTAGGFIFNSQLRALLAGRIDIDPAVIGMEGFVRDGRTYTYFGILPALLRLPLAGQLWRDWTLLSCVFASTLAALALLRAFTVALPRVTVAGYAVAFTLLASGPQVELLGKPTVYMEAVLWSYAFACVFLSVAMPLLTDTARQATRRRLAVLALCAGLALLTRVSTGIGLYAALALLVIVDLWRARPPAGRMPAMMILAGAMVAAAAVNAWRWGDPLQFADLTSNRYYAADPARLTRLAEVGVFAPTRIPHALLYYGAPSVFFDLPPEGKSGQAVARLFDGPEGPPFGIPAAQPLWLLLAIVGAAALARGAAACDRPRGLAVALGLTAAIGIVCSYHYLAFRYRAEFAPLVLLLLLWAARASLPGQGAGQRLQVVVTIGLVLLAALQTVQAHRAFAAHACAPFGSYAAGEQAAVECLGAWRFARPGPDAPGHRAAARESPASGE